MITQKFLNIIVRSIVLVIAMYLNSHGIYIYSPNEFRDKFYTLESKVIEYTHD